MKKVIHWLDDYFEWTVMSILLLCITGILTTQIVCRYVLHNTLSWPEELSRYCFVCSAMFAIPFCIKRDIMLRVDIIFNFFNERMKQILFLVSDAMSLALWVLLWIYSFDVAKSSFNPVTYSVSMPKFPLYIIYCIPCFTLFLTIFRQIQSIIKRLRGLGNISKEAV